MIVLSFINDFFAAIFIVFCGILFSIFIGWKLSIKFSRSFLIYCWHTIFSILYLWYALSFGGDALDYFEKSRASLFDLNFGTFAIIYITNFLTQTVGLSLFDCFMVFNFFGVIGLLAFDGCLQTASRNKNIKRIATLIVFLPSVSFWSSALGKDSISFMAVGLALWAALDLKRRLSLMTFAVIAMLLVSPHMAAMMIIALAMAAMFDSNVALPKKAFMGILSAIVAALIVPFSLSYIGLGDAVSVESVSFYIETRQSSNLEGGGGIDIASMSWPEQMFTYMFRPLIFEINSVYSAAAALDNLILLFLFVIGGWAILRGKSSDLGESRVFMWVYALMAWGVLAMTTANLGIALRQKWMFAPMLIFLFISVMGRRKPLPPDTPHFSHVVHASALHSPARHRQL